MAQLRSGHIAYDGDRDQVNLGVVFDDGNSGLVSVTHEALDDYLRSSLDAEQLVDAVVSLIDRLLPLAESKRAIGAVEADGRILIRSADLSA